MSDDVVDFGSQIQAHEVRFKLFPGLWHNFRNSGPSTSHLTWHEVKLRIPGHLDTESGKSWTLVPISLGR